MNKSIHNVHLFYEEFGKGDNTIVLLHGWGQSHAFWKDVIERLSKEYHIYVVDLPGFGLSQEPSKTWSVVDYAAFIHDFVAAVHVASPIIVGHSFGGRIAVAYASKYAVKKLVLYSNGGLPIVSLKSEFNRHVVVRLGKYFPPNFLYRSHTVLFRPKHYQNTIIVTSKRSRRMLDIYSQPFYNLEKHMKEIKAPTLIFVGSNDYITNPKIGKRTHQLITGSQLVKVPNATHFAHIESPTSFYKALERFLKG